MVLNRWLILAVLAGIFSAPGCSPHHDVKDEIEMPTPAKSELKELQTSPWGELHNGLQCKITAPKEIEQGMPLEAKIEFRCKPENVPQGAKKLNTFLNSAYLKLLLKNKLTEQTFEIRPYNPTHGMPAVDDGKYTAPLDESKIEPWQTTFPLLRARADLVPGVYECRVEFTYSWERRIIGWHGSKEEWEATGFWSGAIASGVFELNILKEAPKTKKFLLPKRFRLEKGLKIMFRKEDAQEVVLPVRNGFFLAAKYYHNDNDNFYRQSGPPVPDDVNYIDYWYGYKGGDKHYTLTIEIFETADPPVHLWHPYAESGGYKVLWKKSFEIHYTEEEIKDLK